MKNSRNLIYMLYNNMYLLLISFFSLFFASSITLTAQIPTSEFEALEALYNETNGPNWTNNNNWLNTGVSVENWAGVTLTASGNNVKEINLTGNNLVGTIPSELEDLTMLERLQLGGNFLVGTIPSELSNLSNLIGLILQENQLSGPIPQSLGSLSNLRRLLLDKNVLTGSISANLGNLNNLEYLYLNDNMLTGSIPFQIGNLSNLEYLYLNNNLLTGTIPVQLGNLSNLVELFLNDNDLDGSIPYQLGDLNNLIDLYLQENNLEGAIPNGLSDMTNLEVLYLQQNNLSETIPPELGDLTNLKELFLDNNLLKGLIPAELENLTSLEKLHLNHNNLVGNIPIELGNLVNLEELFLNKNCLDGLLPIEIRELPNLLHLDISSNLFTGFISLSGGSFPDLNTLNIQDNLFKHSNLYNTIPTPITFIYAPQKNFNLSVNASLLNALSGGFSPDNTYNWYKDGVLLSSQIGVTTYSAPSTGMYHCEMSNSELTNSADPDQNLILRSHPVWIDKELSYCNAEKYNGEIRYVDTAANGANNGLTWDNAYLNLEDALAEARQNKAIGEIWMAKGIYYPSSLVDQNSNLTLEANEATFTLVSGLDIYGGFEGTESRRCQRNLTANATILSGDIDQNDLAIPAQNEGDIQGVNASSIFIGEHLARNSILDGLTFSAGVGGGEFSKGGGAIKIEDPFGFSTSLSIANCNFTGNIGLGMGAAMQISLLDGSKLEIQDCDFYNNASGSYGGAIRIGHRSGEVNIDVVNSDFGKNLSIGGAISYNCFGGSSGETNIVNCLFWENEALIDGSLGGKGGAMSLNVFQTSSHQLNIFNSSFVNNSCQANSGGTLRNSVSSSSTVTIEVNNSLFWNNTANGIQNVHYNENGDAASSISNNYNNCLFNLNSCPPAGTGIAVTSQCTNCIYNQDPLLEDPANGNLEFIEGSPLLNAGDNDLLPFDLLDINEDGLSLSQLLPQDLFDNIRTQADIVDIGAIEGASNIYKVKLFLEGSYESGTGKMNTDLNTVIPNLPPFSMVPWGHSQIPFPGQMPLNAVDWLLMELIDSNDDEVEQVAVLLLADGSMLGANNRTGVPFTSNLLSTGESYQIIVRSRNHLDVLGPNTTYGTDFPLTSTSQIGILDFTNPTQIPSSANQLVDLEGNGTIWGLAAGDIDGDGIISVTDFNDYKSTLNAGNVINVYEESDCSNDTNVTVEDFNLYKSNSSKIGLSQVRYD